MNWSFTNATTPIDEEGGFICYEHMTEPEEKEIDRAVAVFYRKGIVQRVLQTILSERLTDLGPISYARFVLQAAGEVLLAKCGDNYNHDEEQAFRMFGWAADGDEDFDNPFNMTRLLNEGGYSVEDAFNVHLAILIYSQGQAETRRDVNRMIDEVWEEINANEPP